MTKWLLLYKGDFTKNLKGPEIRYIRIAEELAKQGNDVTIAGKKGDRQGSVNFLSVNKKIALFKAFMSSDTVVLHGGGPYILLLSLISKLRGKRVILDNYAPHWLELYSASINSPRKFSLKAKIAFNLFRTLYGIVVFDAVIAANKRQLDLYRGLAASTGNLDLINKIQILSYGADPVVPIKTRHHLKELSNNKIKDGDILLGWIGGLWDWFDYKPIVSSISAVATTNHNVNLVFFGVNKNKEQEIKEYAHTQNPNSAHNFVFLPWIPFEKRLDVWSGLDAGIVWSNPSIENDYAARTRNFDCISARLPIIQNWDDHWGPIIKEKNIGITTTEAELQDDLAKLIINKNDLSEYSKAITLLYEEYSWKGITRSLVVMGSLQMTRPSLIGILSLPISGLLLLLNILLTRK